VFGGDKIRFHRTIKARGWWMPNIKSRKQIIGGPTGNVGGIQRSKKKNAITCEGWTRIEVMLTYQELKKILRKNEKHNYSQVPVRFGRN